MDKKAKLEFLNQNKVLILTILISVFFYHILAYCVVHEISFETFDKPLNLYFNHVRSDDLLPLFDFIRLLGQNEQVLIFILLLSAALLFFKKYSFAFLLLFVNYSGVLLIDTLKSLFFRIRPDHSYLSYNLYGNSSFPSGHAFISVCTFGTLLFIVYNILQEKNKRYFSVSVLIFLILLMGFDRLYLGVHYFTDVCAGYAFGLAWCCFCILIYKIIMKMIENKTLNIDNS